MNTAVPQTGNLRPAAVADSLGREHWLFEVVGHHTDFAPLMVAIKEATRARPSR